MTLGLELAQFVAYVAISAASVIVATVSLLFSRRQNIGWQPLLLLTKDGIGTYKVHGHTVRLNFEVWNRRMYPLLLRSVTVSFASLRLEDPGRHADGEPWHFQPGQFVYLNEVTLVPTGRKPFFLEAPFIADSADGICENITISAHYYDPVKDRDGTLVKQHQWVTASR